MRLRAEIESEGSGVGRFGGVLCVAVSYLPGDVYSKLRAISPSPGWTLCRLLAAGLQYK